MLNSRTDAHEQRLAELIAGLSQPAETASATDLENARSALRVAAARNGDGADILLNVAEAIITLRPASEDGGR